MHFRYPDPQLISIYFFIISLEIFERYISLYLHAYAFKNYLKYFPVIDKQNVLGSAFSSCIHDRVKCPVLSLGKIKTFFTYLLIRHFKYLRPNVYLWHTEVSIVLFSTQVFVLKPGLAPPLLVNARKALKVQHFRGEGICLCSFESDLCLQWPWKKEQMKYNQKNEEKCMLGSNI